jgi:uncharacterized protein YbjT (DUF2867 family)
VEIRRTDLADAASLARDMEGCAAAFYLVHSMMSAGGEYARRDQQLALTFGRAAYDAGLARLIYLGGLGETAASRAASVPRRGGESAHPHEARQCAPP